MNHIGLIKLLIKGHFSANKIRLLQFCRNFSCWVSLTVRKKISREFKASKSLHFNLNWRLSENMWNLVLQVMHYWICWRLHVAGGWEEEQGESKQKTSSFQLQSEFFKTWDFSGFISKPKNSSTHSKDVMINDKAVVPLSSKSKALLVEGLAVTSEQRMEAAGLRLWQMLCTDCIAPLGGVKLSAQHGGSDKLFINKKTACTKRDCVYKCSLPSQLMVVLPSWCLFCWVILTVMLFLGAFFLANYPNGPMWNQPCQIRAMTRCIQHYTFC